MHADATRVNKMHVLFEKYIKKMPFLFLGFILFSNVTILFSPLKF